MKEYLTLFYSREVINLDNTGLQHNMFMGCYIKGWKREVQSFMLQIRSRSTIRALQTYSNKILDIDFFLSVFFRLKI